MGNLRLREVECLVLGPRTGKYLSYFQVLYRISAETGGGRELHCVLQDRSLAPHCLGCQKPALEMHFCEASHVFAQLWYIIFLTFRALASPITPHGHSSASLLALGGLSWVIT